MARIRINVDDLPLYLSTTSFPWALAGASSSSTSAYIAARYSTCRRLLTSGAASGKNSSGIGATLFAPTSRRTDSKGAAHGSDVGEA